MNAALRRKIERELDKPGCVELYESIEGGKVAVLKKMRKLALKGWRVVTFGWANGFQGGWYALMKMDRTYDGFKVVERLLGQINR